MLKHQVFGFMTAAAIAAALSLPMAAQTTANQTSGSQTSATSPASNANATAPANANASANANANTRATQADQPLQPQIKQGFWGRMNPFARKKYVQGQIQPVRDRVNEVDGLTHDNANAISDLDARSKAGIADASNRAQQANQTADSAQQQVQQAQTQADQLNQQVGTANTKIEGVDQYQVAQQAELHFKPGPAKLNPNATQQLDQFFQGLDRQKGYVVEVTAYSTRKGAAGISASQNLADAVVRYLVTEKNVPLYRIYTMGMGNASPAAAQVDASASAAKATAGGTVEIKILKNSLAQ